MTGTQRDSAIPNDQVRERADQLFQERFDANIRTVDRTFAYLMMVQWVLGVALSLVISPYAWAGKQHVIHEHVLLAVFLGGAISGLPILLAFQRPGWIVTRNVIAVAQMLWSALLIHLTGGRIETHFHVFGSLAFLAFYRDWKVLVPATVVVAFDHLLRQVFWPESVFGILAPESWRFLEHAAWVVFEDIFLVLSCIGGVREMRNIAQQQARIEFTEQLEREMEIAAQIQTAILPRQPNVKGLEIAAKMLPASEVGGDYYDVLPVDDGCWIGIGDVAGHGLVAGLVMLQTQSAVKAVVQQDPKRAPRDVLNVVNNVVFENVRRRMGHDSHMTMSLVRYYRDGRMIVAGAHQEILICRAATGTCERLPSRGTWVGLVEDIAPFTEESTHKLEDGDLVILYTDGITEAMNAGSEQFGLDRLSAKIEELHQQPVSAIRDRVFEAIATWSKQRQDDDVTLLVLRHQRVLEQAAA